MRRFGTGTTRRRVAAFAAAGLTATLAVGGPAAGGASAATSGATPGAKAVGTETYRPQFHFSPEKNWMNDPNGLVYYKGEYHLFFQYNPEGNTWGNMSWGHAVSRDLVHWKQLPLAIPHDDKEAVFSGSAVVDRNNTSGFGTRTNPAMVAIYTSAFNDGRQAQSLAYSTDRGRTWTKYRGNPVLDIGSHEFRDPKVQWYAPTKSWLMTVSLSTEHKVRFYSSKDLKSWNLLSEFGPAGAVGGVWECPDLFPLPVDGDRRHTKWVLVVNINPGGIAGGSAAQYFVGDFDGKRFTADDKGSYTPPSGAVTQGFEQATYGSWTASGKAFGSGPAFGPLPGQSDVAGVEGRGHADSFHGGDASTGLLTSPTFTATTPYLNFKVGGGRHPHDPNAALDPPTPTGTVLADFEGSDYGSWRTTGEAFGTGPAAGSLGDQQEVSGYLGKGLVNTFLRSERTGGNGDSTIGTLTSPDFTISKGHLNFLIGGGNHPASSDAPTAVELVVDGRVVRSATGKDSEALNWASWDVRDLAGKTARLRVVDENTGGWGHLLLDQVLLSDTAAKPRSTETAVNLLVGGKVVQSATGSDSESLDWASFDLRPYLGKQVRVQLVDQSTAGWGHVLADQFVAAQAPALSTVQRAHWVDFGKDYYAAVSWEDVPGGKRYMIGWMNNWQYGGSIPTSPWRSAMSVPREMGLRTLDGRIRLVQQPVRTVKSLRTGRPVTAKRVPIHSGSVRLADGKALDIKATFSVKHADRFGLKVRAGKGQHTTIGYDVTTQEVYVDRRTSGDVGFSTDFPGVQRAPLPVRNGKVHLRVLVDWSSVEVFGGRSGEAVITDQVFPDPSSRAVEVFARGGSARLDSLKVWQMGNYRR